MNSGLSPDSAWKTINKLNNSWSLIQDGDDILFKRGAIFTDATLIINKGGTPSDPMIIGAYGSGPAPIIDCGPNNLRGGIYCNKPNLGYIRIQDLAVKNVNEGQSILFEGENLSHITISRVEIDGNTDRNGILLIRINNYTIEDCVISNCGNCGIAIIGTPSYPITNGLIRNNIIHDIGGNDGITLHKDGQGYDIGPNHQILDNLLYNCAEQGLDITSGDNITVQNNETYNNQEGGVLIDHGASNVWVDKHFSHDESFGVIVGTSANVKLTSSVIYNPSYQSLVILYCKKFEAYNNTIVHGSEYPIIDICAGTDYITFKNNIITSKYPDRPSRYIRYLEGTTPGNTNSHFDYNVWWLSNPSDSRMWWDGINLLTFSGWKSNWNHEAHSLFIDPKLTDLGGKDFHLQSSSPCIDTGINVGLVSDFENNSIPKGFAPDIGAYEFSNASPLPLLASASASPTSGQAPLTVSFIGSADRGAPSYTFSWNFGDGQSSSLQSASHTYNSSGIYTATFTVTDSLGTIASQSVNISVTSAASPIVASVTASRTSGQAPLMVNLMGSASGGVAPYSFSWNFGDGQTSTNQNPSHTYSNEGRYIAILTATDSHGTSDSESITINVNSASMPLTASASASPMSGNAPLSVYFTANAIGGTPPYSYSWNFRDGQKSAIQSPSHIFTTPGTYTVILAVTDNKATTATATVVINATSSLISTYTLSLSSETGAPAPGQGGTTDPPPGNRSFSVGNTVLLRSIINPDYRFSKWNGDIIDSEIFNSQTTVVMDINKSLAAYFCTKCGDVNGNLRITPSDAQAAFDIFLGKISNPTWCEKENADVNGSGTKLDPKVTPADAQVIFHKFLKKGELLGDCSGNSRSTTLSTQQTIMSGGSIVINNRSIREGEDIVIIPILVELTSGISAFGFDLGFPGDNLMFLRVERGNLTQDFDELEANMISNGVLRVGGFKIEEPINSASTGVLVTLVFKIIKEEKELSSFSIVSTYDDIQNVSIGETRINQKIRGDAQRQTRRVAQKKYDF